MFLILIYFPVLLLSAQGLRSLAIWLVLLLSLIPAFYINRIMQRKIRPRQSWKRLLTYILLALAFVFIYCYAIVWVILHLFPVSMK